jgi:phage gp36-like protein
MYSTTQLAAMTGSDQAHLERICCEIAWYLLLSRRIIVVTDEYLKMAGDKYADHLESLRNGKRVFAIADNREAGLPMLATPSSVELNNLNTIAARSRGHFYPNRVMPAGRP